MPGSSVLFGMAMIVIVVAGVGFLLGLFYLGDRGTGRYDDSDGRYRRRY
ncbi:hypothetical protein [Actinomadura sp.]|jgi:hypothetical protein